MPPLGNASAAAVAGVLFQTTGLLAFAAAETGNAADLLRRSLPPIARASPGLTTVAAMLVGPAALLVTSAAIVAGAANRLATPTE